MKEILIDCAAITDRESLHDILSRELDFPQWYGRNLDALHDCLAAICEEACITLKNWDTAEAALGKYGKTARKLLEEADWYNPCVHVIFE